MRFRSPLAALLFLAACGWVAGYAGDPNAPLAAPVAVRHPIAPVPPRGATPSATPAYSPQINELRRRLDKADRKPFSTSMEIRTYIDGSLAMSRIGRVNMNSASTGRFRTRIPSSPGGSNFRTYENILLGYANYERELKADGERTNWYLTVAFSENRGLFDPNDLFRVEDYVELMTALGEKTVHGYETVQGVPAIHLSGEITADDAMNSGTPLAYLISAAQIKAIVCDLWVDRSGRVARLEFRIDERDQHGILTMWDFRPPFTQKAPPP